MENKGCPFLIDIEVNARKGEIKYEIVNNPLKYHELIFKLKEYCNAMTEYQVEFYKENEYFRFVYEKQLYRLFKRTKRKDKDISSYVRFLLMKNQLMMMFHFLNQYLMMLQRLINTIELLLKRILI